MDDIPEKVIDQLNDVRILSVCNMLSFDEVWDVAESLGLTDLAQFCENLSKMRRYQRGVLWMEALNRL